MAFRISVDTGGTFTDVVVADPQGGLRIGKALTTPDRIFDGMGAALDNVAGEMGLDRARLLADADLFKIGRAHV